MMAVGSTLSSTLDGTRIDNPLTFPRGVGLQNWGGRSRIGSALSAGRQRSGRATSNHSRIGTPDEIAVVANDYDCGHTAGMA